MLKEACTIAIGKFKMADWLIDPKTDKVVPVMIWHR
jgi:hypothetical protein